jgi:hypothetical protein
VVVSWTGDQVSCPVLATRHSIATAEVLGVRRDESGDHTAP